MASFFKNNTQWSNTIVAYLHKTLKIIVKYVKLCVGHTPIHSCFSSSHVTRGSRFKVNICWWHVTGKLCTFKTQQPQKCKTSKWNNTERNDSGGLAQTRIPSVPGSVAPDELSPVHCRWSCTWRGVYPCSLPSQAESQLAPLSSASVSLKTQQSIKGRIFQGHSHCAPGKRGRLDLRCSQPDYALLAQIMAPCSVS